MSAIDGINQYFIPNTLDGLNPITSEVNATALLIDGSNSMAADLDVGNHRIKNLQAAVSSTEAVNLAQLANYALDNTVVHLAGTETITGNKTFAGTLSAGQVYATGSNFTTYIANVGRLNVAPTGTTASLNAGSSIYSAIQGTAGVKSIGLYPDLSAGAYNSGTQPGDVGIFSAAGTANTTNLIVAPHTSTATGPSGIRMTPFGTTCFKPLDMFSQKITSLANGTSSTDAATYGQLTTGLGNYLPLAGGTMSGQINMGSQQINSLANGTVSSDAATYGQLTTGLSNYLPLAGGTMSGSISMGSQQITNLADGTLATDAATVGQLTTLGNNYVTLGTAQTITAKKTFSVSQQIGTNQSLEFNANSVSSNGMNHFYDTTAQYGNIYVRGTGLRIRQRLGGSPDSAPYTKVDLTQSDVQIGPGVAAAAGTYPDLSMHGGRFVGPRLPRWSSGWFAVNHNTQYNWTISRTADLTPSMYWSGSSTGWFQIPLEFRVLFSLTTNNPTSTYVFDVTSGSMPSNYDDHHSLAWLYDSGTDSYNVNLSTGDTYVTCYRDPIAGTYQRPQSGYMIVFIY